MSERSQPVRRRLSAAVACVSAACLLAVGCVDSVGGVTGGSAKSGERSERKYVPDDAFGAALTGQLTWLKEKAEEDPAVLKKTNQAGWTLLHVAAQGNQPAIIEYLVENGLKIEARDGLGNTPLHHAASRGSLEAAKTLVRLGADPTARSLDPVPNASPGISVLSKATLAGHPEMVQFLLDQGAPIVYGEADWKKEGYPRETALHWAMLGSTDWKDPKRAADRLAVIDLLAKKIGDVNVVSAAFEGGTPLHLAAMRRQPEIVRHLLENYPEVDVDAKNMFGKRPAELVRSNGPVGDKFVQQRVEKDAAEVIRLLSEAHAAKARAKKDAAKNVEETDVE